MDSINIIMPTLLGRQFTSVVKKVRFLRLNLELVLFLQNYKPFFYLLFIYVELEIKEANKLIYTKAAQTKTTNQTSLKTFTAAYQLNPNIQITSLLVLFIMAL